MDIRGTIREYIGQAAVGKVSDDDDIFATGAVNSLFAVELVLFVELEFGFKVEREDLDVNNFSSVSALSAFVTRKCDSAG